MPKESPSAGTVLRPASAPTAIPQNSGKPACRPVRPTGWLGVGIWGTVGGLTLAVLGSGGTWIIPVQAQSLVADLADFVVTDEFGGAPGEGEGPGIDGAPLGEARFATPQALRTAPDGALWIVDTGHHCLRERFRDAAGVERLREALGRCGESGESPPLNEPTPTGIPASEVRLRHPMDLAWVGSDTVVVADTGHHRLLVWNRRQATVAELRPIFIAEDPAAPRNFHFPRGIAVSPRYRTRLYVADTGHDRVVRIDLDGQARVIFNVAARPRYDETVRDARDQGGRRPTDIAPLPARPVDRLLVALSGDNTVIALVERENEPGAFYGRTIVGNPEAPIGEAPRPPPGDHSRVAHHAARLVRPYRLALDTPRLRLWLSDFGAGQALAVDLNTLSVTGFPMPPSAAPPDDEAKPSSDATVSRPVAATFTTVGHVFTVDTEGRIRRWQPPSP